MLKKEEAWKNLSIEDMKGEIWKPIIEYEDLYLISNYGRIKSIKGNIIIKTRLLYDYVYTSLNKNGKARNFRVHKLVLRHFVSEPPKHNSVVGHEDNNKSNNFVGNLYWTTSRENTIKAIEDGLLINDMSENDSQSIKVKALDKCTNEIVGVYGSIRECARCIENLEDSFVSKVIFNDPSYKPRSKKYKYLKCSDDEFLQNIDLKSKILIESEKVDKRPTRFLITYPNGDVEELDNQKQLSYKIGIPQAIISKLIKNNSEMNGYKFEMLEKIKYENSTAYDNFMNNLPEVRVRNIFTDEIIIVKAIEDLKEKFGFTGNGLTRNNNKYLINGEWEIIK